MSLCSTWSIPGSLLEVFQNQINAEILPFSLNSCEPNFNFFYNSPFFQGCRETIYNYETWKNDGFNNWFCTKRLPEERTRRIWSSQSSGRLFCQASIWGENRYHNIHFDPDACCGLSSLFYFGSGKEGVVLRNPDRRVPSEKSRWLHFLSHCSDAGDNFCVHWEQYLWLGPVYFDHTHFTSCGNFQGSFEWNGKVDWIRKSRDSSISQELHSDASGSHQLYFGCEWNL